MAYRRKNLNPQKIKLLTLDPDGETYVVVRHATGADELAVNSVASESVFTWKTDTGLDINERVLPPQYVVRAARVWAVLDECNILDEKGKRHFPKERQEWTDFLNLWNQLLTPEQEAIYKAVVEVNPHWGK